MVLKLEVATVSHRPIELRPWGLLTHYVFRVRSLSRGQDPSRILFPQPDTLFQTKSIAFFQSLRIQGRYPFLSNHRLI